MNARNSEKVPVTTSAKESTVFETILPQQKKKRRPDYTLRIRRRYERKGECSFRDLFTPAEKEDDGYLRLEYGRILYSAGERYKRKKYLPFQ